MLSSWKPIWLLCATLPWIGLGISSSSSPERAPISLTAWRKLDAHGRACASCHSPDGLEIALYNFDDADVLRRAKDHLGSEDAEAIVKQIHAVRDEYGIRSLLDPMNDRPLQPGGQVLPGDSPLARDKAFAGSLPKVLPRFFSGRIASLAEAKAALAELLKVDLTNLKVGIPFDRLSEDGFHGNEHATIANWISDVPLAHELPEAQVDAYLKSPSEKTLAPLDAELTNEENYPMSGAQEIAATKRRSLFYYTTMMRARLTGGAKVTPGFPNPMWMVAESARAFGSWRLQDLRLPSEIAAKKVQGPSLKEQMAQIRLPWYWMGWISDPGLQHSSGQGETQKADYFTKFLASDGPYPMHEAFMIARKVAEQSFVPSAWGAAPPQHMVLFLSNFTDDKGYATPLPSDPEHLRLFKTFSQNVFRMLLYLQADEYNRTHTSYWTLSTAQQIRRLGAALESPADKALARRALVALGEAKSADP